MKNVSNEFKNIIKSGGPFFSYATVVLADGTSLTLDSYDDFSDDGNSYSESGGDGFPLGVALSKQITINLENTDGRFSEYDFYGAIFTAYTEADLPDVTTERIPEGIFTVIDSVAPGDVLEITAYDNMYKLDSPFSSKLNYPATLQQMWNELCSYYDLTNGSPSFANNDFTVTSAPTDITGRELAGYIAQMAIGNAIVDKNGRLCIKSYDFTLFDDMKIISGGVFGDNVSDSIAGGVFGDGLSSSVSGGTFESLSGYHLLSDFINDPDISTDDVKITGIQTTVRNEEDDEDTVLIYGTDEYALSISNPLITGKEQTAISMIGDALIGVTVRPFSGSFSPDPTIEFMDLVYVVDKKDNIYASFVTDNNFEYLGNSDISNGLEPPERNRSTYSGNATEVYRRVQQQINNQKNDFETAVDNLENQLQNASGLYETDETQPDGSTIYYFHNKPTLGESDTIIKITSQALGISTDGGESYPVGITVDGEAIVSILQTVGINADWITTGAIQVSDDDGNIIFSVNMDTKQIIISGDSVQIGGKPAPDALNDILQESKDYSDGKLADFANTVTENIENLQNQVDGQIETYYEDYEPSLQNYPANEWTTTEERQKHEGDLFFWKSKGYAYRFFQDGATWKWQMVQDTDITSALTAAEKAQDTADGKRRVFVFTPQPPYDIGDLWCNGEDILTCSTARPQGSLYVSSDWEKLNSYTDDTLANEALEEARQARNLNIILDNEYQGIPADYEGNIGTFPEVKTFVQVLYGHTDVSTDCIYAITKSNSVTGSWDNATRTYTVTGLSEDTGWVDITASYLSLFTTTKRFNVQKVKDGEPGEDGPPGAAGAPGRTYTIEPSVNVLKRASDNSIAPNFIKFNAYYRDGNSATRTAYAGRWIIEETADGDEWTTIYTSSANENSVTHYLYSMLADSDGSAIANANGDTIGIPRDIVAIRAKLYAAGGTTNLLDMQSVAVVIDVDNLTHEEIFNLLTNNGAIQGIYQEGNQIYINAEYIQTGTMSADRIYGGTLSLGGANNSGGVFNLYDENGTLKSVMDNDGFNFWDGENFVGSIRTRYMEEYERGCCAICADNVSVIALSSDYIFDNDPDSKVFDSDIYITNTEIYVDGQYKLPGVHLPRNVYFENYMFIGEDGSISESVLGSSKVLKIYENVGDDIWIGANSNEFGDTEVRIYGDLHQMTDPSNPSDERLKTKITPFSESAIDIINDIQIYGYTWIESGKSEKAGFIAQQLESDVSADFTKTGKDGVHNVKPTKMIPYLVKAVQELSEEIESLKKEICDLKGENYTPKEHKKDKWKPSDMSLEEKRDFIEKISRTPKEG